LFVCLNCLQTAREFPSAIEGHNSRFVKRHIPEIEASFMRHGVTNAYSLYWHCSVEDVLTDGRIEVHGLRGDLTPTRYLDSYAAYAPERAGERTAFIRVDLSYDKSLESYGVYNITNPAVLDEAVDVDVIPDPEYDVVIYYFDRNPFVFPPGHDPTGDYEPPELAEGGPGSAGE
jgi:hypothetical protein